MKNSRLVSEMAARATVFFIMFYIVSAGLLNGVVGVEAADGSPAAVNELRGSPFSNPDKTFPMSDEWKKLPIKYEPWAEGADLAVVLDQQMYPALVSLVQEFAKKNRIYIATKEGTCGISGGMLRKKSVDVAGFCCAPGDLDRLPGLRYHNLGLAALAVMTFKENTLDNISMSDLQQVYRGRVSKWSELKDSQGRPGPDVPITAVARLHCKNLRPGDWCLILKNDKLFSPRLVEVGVVADLVRRVADTRGAVGFETLWGGEFFKADKPFKILKVDGLDPRDPKSLISGGYRLYRVFDVTTWEDPAIAKPLAKQLVEFLMKNFDRTDASYYFISADKLKPVASGWKFKGDELVGEPDGATR
jgi:hypothetical protein